MPSREGKSDLSDEERAQILHLAEQLDYPVSKIAEELGRADTTIYRFLRQFKSTTHLARRFAESKAYALTAMAVEETLEQKNIDAALEIADRVDALPRKRATLEGARGASLIVCVGMPNAPACTVPAQIFVDRVRLAAAPDEIPKLEDPQ